VALLPFTLPADRNGFAIPRALDRQAHALEPFAGAAQFALAALRSPATARTFKTQFHLSIDHN
jgi:hypothetical protein